MSDAGSIPPDVQEHLRRLVTDMWWPGHQLAQLVARAAEAGEEQPITSVLGSDDAVGIALDAIAADERLRSTVADLREAILHGAFRSMRSDPRAVNPLALTPQLCFVALLLRAATLPDSPFTRLGSADADLGDLDDVDRVDDWSELEAWDEVTWDERFPDDETLTDYITTRWQILTGLSNLILGQVLSDPKPPSEAILFTAPEPPPLPTPSDILSELDNAGTELATDVARGWDAFLARVPGVTLWQKFAYIFFFVALLPTALLLSAWWLRSAESGSPAAAPSSLTVEEPDEPVAPVAVTQRQFTPVDDEVAAAIHDRTAGVWPVLIGQLETGLTVAGLDLVDAYEDHTIGDPSHEQVVSGDWEVEVFDGVAGAELLSAAAVNLGPGDDGELLLLTNCSDEPAVGVDVGGRFEFRVSPRPGAVECGDFVVAWRSSAGDVAIVGGSPIVTDQVSDGRYAIDLSRIGPVGVVDSSIPGGFRDPASGGDNEVAFLSTLFALTGGVPNVDQHVAGGFPQPDVLFGNLSADVADALTLFTFVGEAGGISSITTATTAAVPDDAGDVLHALFPAGIGPFAEVAITDTGAPFQPGADWFVVGTAFDELAPLGELPENVGFGVGLYGSDAAAAAVEFALRSEAGGLQLTAFDSEGSAVDWPAVAILRNNAVTLAMSTEALDPEAATVVLDYGGLELGPLAFPRTPLEFVASDLPTFELAGLDYGEPEQPAEDPVDEQSGVPAEPSDQLAEAVIVRDMASQAFVLGGLLTLLGFAIFLTTRTRKEHESAQVGHGPSPGDGFVVALLSRPKGSGAGLVVDEGARPTSTVTEGWYAAGVLADVLLGKGLDALSEADFWTNLDGPPDFHETEPASEPAPAEGHTDIMSEIVQPILVEGSGNWIPPWRREVPPETRAADMLEDAADIGRQAIEIVGQHAAAGASHPVTDAMGDPAMQDLAKRAVAIEQEARTLVKSTPPPSGYMVRDHTPLMSSKDVAIYAIAWLFWNLRDWGDPGPVDPPTVPPPGQHVDSDIMGEQTHTGFGGLGASQAVPYRLTHGDFREMAEVIGDRSVSNPAGPAPNDQHAETSSAPSMLVGGTIAILTLVGILGLTSLLRGEGVPAAGGGSVEPIAPVGAVADPTDDVGAVPPSVAEDATDPEGTESPSTAVESPAATETAPQSSPGATASSTPTAQPSPTGQVSPTASPSPTSTSTTTTSPSPSPTATVTSTTTASPSPSPSSSATPGPWNQVAYSFTTGDGVTCDGLFRDRRVGDAIEVDDSISCTGAVNQISIGAVLFPAGGGGPLPACSDPAPGATSRSCQGTTSCPSACNVIHQAMVQDDTTVTGSSSTATCGGGQMSASEWFATCEYERST